MRIGEVARRSGVSVRMLRHYDALGLVRPSSRSGAGYREYGEQDLQRLGQVESLRALGLTLAEASRALDDPTYDPRRTIDELARRTAERVAEEEAVLALLRQVDATRPDAWEDVLAAVAHLRTWGSAGPATRQSRVLGSSGFDVPTPVLVVQLLEEDDPHVQGALRWRVARRDDAVEHLRPALGSSEAQQRRRAVSALAEIEDASATDALLTALDDADDVVVATAAVAAGLRGRTAAQAPLVAMVVEGRHDVEAGEALAALARVPGPPSAVVAGLEHALVGAPTPVRLRLVQALAEVDGSDSSAALATLVDDPDPVVAATAAHVLQGRHTGPGGPRTR